MNWFHIPGLDEFLGRNPKLRMVLLVADQRQALVTEIPTPVARIQRAAARAACPEITG